MNENNNRTPLTFVTKESECDVHSKLLNWLDSNAFKILSENCNLDSITYGSLFVPFDLAGPYIKLKVKRGSIVALYLERVVRKVYAVIFEIMIIYKGKETKVTLEGYAAGTGLLAKKELSLQNKPGVFGCLPRKKGFDLLNKFREDFSEYKFEA